MFLSHRLQRRSQSGVPANWVLRRVPSLVSRQPPCGVLFREVESSGLALL